MLSVIPYFCDSWYKFIKATENKITAIYNIVCGASNYSCYLYGGTAEIIISLE
jgi:hypothetical protein